MALAVSLNFTVLDAKGKSSITKIRVPTGFSVTQYAEAASALAQLIANLSEGAITDVSVSLPLSLSGATIRATALGIADVAKKALFVARTAVAGLFTKWNFPTYDEVNSVAGSDDVNEADTEVAAMIAILEDGINVSGTIVTPRDARGNLIDSVSEAREIFRKFG
jgi:hypothetical protein